MLTRIAILEDHPMICSSIEFQIHRTEDFAFAGRYGTIESASELLFSSKVDVLVSDLHLSDGIAIPLIRRLTSETSTQVVVYTASDHPLMSSVCESAGVIATLSKSEFGDDFMASVRDAIRRSGASCDESSAGSFGSESQDVKALTEREWDVLLLMGEGQSTTDIASSLHISGKTVESHRSAIKRKLNVRTKDQLISLAARWSSLVA